MRVFKKSICIVVIFALAVSLVPTTASASALTVVGTSFTSAGLTSAEFAASAGPYAIGILAAVAAAYGIKTFVQSDTGQAVKEFFQGLIEKRAMATRRSVAEQMEALLGNATIDEDGNINLGRLSFAEARETLMLEDIPAEKPDTIANITLKDFHFMNSLSCVFHGRYIYYLNDKSSTLNNMFFVNSGQYKGAHFVVPYNPGTTVTYYREDIVDGEIKESGTLSFGSTWSIKIGSNYYSIVNMPYHDYQIPSYAPINNVVSMLEGSPYALDDLKIDYSNDTLYGVDETLRDQNIGLHEGLILAPDLINSAVIGGAAGEISASDYCGALVDYVSGYDTMIDGVTVTGLPEAATVPRSIDEAPTSDTVIDEAPPSTMTGTEAAGLYAFSLDELFPFCLPFDFVKIIEKFNVQPEAPNFDWRFYIPGIVDYTLHIDLSAWNSAAEVCRTMVLIAFMVGLIMLTRQIFIRA